MFLDHWMPSRLWILCRGYLGDKGKHLWKRIMFGMWSVTFYPEGDWKDRRNSWSAPKPAAITFLPPSHFSPQQSALARLLLALPLCAAEVGHSSCSLPLQMRHHYYRGVAFPRIPGFFSINICMQRSQSPIRQLHKMWESDHWSTLSAEKSSWKQMLSKHYENAHVTLVI